MATGERVFAIAIKRDGRIWDGGKSSHWQLRKHLGDENPEKPKRGDVEGFVISPGGRFADRREAHAIAFEAGQTSRLGTPGDRNLLSSEVKWD